MRFALAVMLVFAVGVPAQEASPGANWLNYNNSLDGQRYSALRQINVANAAQLGEVCRVQIDGPTSFHGGLLVRDGVIYTSTARETVALDATSCALKWKFVYQPEEPRCGGSNRGVALMDGRVFRGTCDGRLVALDAATGTLLWKYRREIAGRAGNDLEHLRCCGLPLQRLRQIVGALTQLV
jgi:glucose dehydrogenase